MSLGERIARFRKLHEWTQDELASKLGVHGAHVSRWETDMVRPRLKTLTQLADLLGVSLDDLTRDNGSAEPLTRDQATLRLVRDVEQLDEEDRVVVQKVIEAMLTKKRVKKALEAV